jgi:sugar phosphate isomerase/epimerase
MNRRAFISASVAATLAASRPFWASEARHSLDRIGVQLYTVRAAMKSDFGSTLAQVAAIGYKEVEFAGYFGHSPEQLRATLDKLGLTAPSCHVNYPAVQMMWPQTLDAAHTLGHKFVVCAWIDEKQRQEPDGYQRAADLFNKAGEASRKAGIQFCYHNYSFEFAPAASLGGQLPYDFLLAQLDPKLVKMELDLCWITVGGRDPLVYFEKYPGRFPLVHVKDWLKDGGASGSYRGATGPSVEFRGRLTDVGSGSVDWKRIFAQSEKAGIQHYFVEQDEPADAFASIRNSFKFLRALRF